MCGLAQAGGVGDSGFVSLVAGVGLLGAGVGLLGAGLGLLVAGVRLLVETELWLEHAFSGPPSRLSYSAMPASVERIAIIRQTTGTGNAQFTSVV